MFTWILPDPSHLWPGAIHLAPGIVSSCAKWNGVMSAQPPPRGRWVNHSRRKCFHNGFSAGVWGPICWESPSRFPLWNLPEYPLGGDACQPSSSQGSHHSLASSLPPWVRTTEVEHSWANQMTRKTEIATRWRFNQNTNSSETTCESRSNQSR